MSHLPKEGLDQPDSSGAVKPMEQSAKIAMIPFAPGEPPVHLLDAAGKASSARCASGPWAGHSRLIFALPHCTFCLVSRLMLRSM